MDSNETPPRRSRGRGAALAGAGLVGGVVLAGTLAASAQTPTPTPSTPQQQDAQPGPPGGGRGGHGHGGPGMGMGIHGEFTTPAPGGGYQTLATQVGEVTAVSATSVTVKSEDGFSRTYTVNDDTLVNAGNDGIADVKSGDDVRVVALVVDGKANAVDVMDATKVGALRDKWQPPRPDAPADGTTGTTGTTGTAAT
jgi:hypothetical protein